MNSVTLIALSLLTAGFASAPPAAAQSAPAAVPDLAAQKRAFAQCRACHVLDKGAAGMAGPSLGGIYAKKAGSQTGFAYSAAMKSAQIIWTDEALDKFLASPARTIPGNRMPFAGVKAPAQRQAIIAAIKGAR